MVNTTETNHSYPALSADSIHYVEVNISFEDDGDWRIDSKYNRTYRDHKGVAFFFDIDYLEYVFNKDTRQVENTIEPDDISFAGNHSFYYSKINQPLGAEQWYRLDDMIIMKGMSSTVAKDINLTHREDIDVLLGGNSYTGEKYHGNATEVKCYS